MELRYLRNIMEYLIKTSPSETLKAPCHKINEKRIENNSIGLISISCRLLMPFESYTPESERARDQCQSVAVTPQVNLSFSFLSRVSTHLNEINAIDS